MPINKKKPDCSTRQKADSGMVLSLIELAEVTGYGVSSLREMKLPLLHHKISLRDFWRIMRKRQDEIEAAQSHVAVYDEHGQVSFSAFKPKPGLISPIGSVHSVTGWTPVGQPLKSVSSTAEGARYLQAAVDKLRAPQSSNGRRGASPSRAGRPARNNGL